jgi:hypothetical protein
MHVEGDLSRKHDGLLAQWISCFGPQYAPQFPRAQRDRCARLVDQLSHGHEAVDLASENDISPIAMQAKILAADDKE